MSCSFGTDRTARHALLNYIFLRSSTKAGLREQRSLLDSPCLMGMSCWRNSYSMAGWQVPSLGRHCFWFRVLLWALHLIQLSHFQTMSIVSLEHAYVIF